MAEKYTIINIAADMHRGSYLKQEFEEVGLPLEIVRSGPLTHNKLSPLVESIFADETIIFGDNPVMRWYCNNVYIDYDKRGNVTYNKVEPKLRKTDGFYSLLHALVIDDELQEAGEPIFLNTITF